LRGHRRQRRQRHGLAARLQTEQRELARDLGERRGEVGQQGRRQEDAAHAAFGHPGHERGHVGA
jgi:hypothetical protein